MACNAPINIIRKEADKCSLKCLLWYKYGNSSCTVKNTADQLIIPYDGASDVMFNSVHYSPVELRIFTPSLHKFDGSYADAEIIVVHSGSNGGLLICIPISSSSNTNASTGLNVLDDIIQHAPNQNASSSLNITDFNLNHMIPHSGYFSYVGTLPYGTCNPAEYNYVVFPRNAMVVKKSTLDKLKQLIHDSYVTVKEGSCYWNEMGTKSNGFSGDGQIYIDCQPTGEEGEIIYKENIKPLPKFNLDWLYAFLYIIVGVILMYLGVKLIKGVMSVLKVSDKNSGVSYDAKTKP
jgi:carbonic anhydrase